MRITKDFLKKNTGEYDLEVVQWLELPNIGIKCIENLDGCTSLRTLTLTGNQITKICGLDGLQSLERLDLSSNSITQIENLEHLTNLQSLDLKDNKIMNANGVKTLTSLPNLRRLFLQGYQSDVGNPACQHPAYHVIITRLLPRLEVLDGESIDLRKCMADVILESATPNDDALKSPRQQRWCEAVCLFSVATNPGLGCTVYPAVDVSSDYVYKGFDWTPYPTDSEIEEGLRVETEKLVDLLQDCEHIDNKAKDALDKI